MIKKRKYIFGFIAICLVVFTIKVSARSTVTSSFSGNSTVNPGAGTVSLNLKGLNGKSSSFIVFLESSNNSVLSIAPKSEKISHDQGGVITVHFTAHAPGTATIKIVNKGSLISAGAINEYPFDEFDVVGSYTITVKNPTSSGGGGGGGGGGSTSTPKPPVKDDTEGEKAGNTLTEEQKKKAEEERKKQELEALKKVPLIKEVKISSDADKMNGELLTTINPTDNMFDYSYQLPRKVDKAIIEVPAVEDVTLTYDKNVAFSEGEASKVVEIKAVKGEIEQVFKITLTNDITPDVIRDVSDKSLTVYQDERASVFFKTLGLETVIPENPLIGSVFENEHLKLQLLINEKEEAQFYLLDNEYEIVEPVSVIKGSDEMIVAVQNSNEITQESIRGQKQVTKEHDSVVTLEDIDSQINIKKTTTYWEIEDGDIFYGTSSTGIENTFIVDKELGFSNILVSFDQINNQQTNIIIGLSVALITIVSTNIVYIATHFIKKRKYR